MMLLMFNTLVILLALCVNFNAQTVITNSDRLQWNQEAPSLMDVKRFGYIVYIDSNMRYSLEDVICSGISSPFACNSKFPLLTSGIHSLEISTIDMAEGPKSAPILIQVTAPSAPQNVSILKQDIIINHYVRSDAIGASSGNDWTNAYKVLPPVLIRGDRYFIADGTYPEYIFDDGESGTAKIIVRKATILDHGTNIGWDNIYGEGQAIFTGTLLFKRGYYEINGVTRNEANWQDSSSYGIKIMPPNRNGVVEANDPDPLSIVNNLTLKYLDMGGDGFCDMDPNVGLYATTNTRSGWYLGYSHIHNVDIPIRTQNITNFTIEQNYIGPSWSKEAISNENGSDWIIRNNHFIDNLRFPPVACQLGGDGATADVWTRSGTNDRWEIYGNVFADTGMYNDIQRSGAIVLGDTATGIVNNWKVYNNTFYNIGGNNAALIVSGGSGNVSYNNLWYKVRAQTPPSSNLATSVWDNGFNTHIAAWCFMDTILMIHKDCEDLTASMLILGSENPFVDVSTFNFHLKPYFIGPSPINKGISLGIGFNNIDGSGRIRGSDGLWDIGAFELEN